MDTTYTGTLQISVASALGMSPIPGATVTISPRTFFIPRHYSTALFWVQYSGNGGRIWTGTGVRFGDSGRWIFPAADSYESPECDRGRRKRSLQRDLFHLVGKCYLCQYPADSVFYLEQGLHGVVERAVVIRGKNKVICQELMVNINTRKIRWLRHEFDIVAL